MTSDNRHKVLQGLAGLAAGRRPGCHLLQIEQDVSQIRFVWNDKSTPAVFRVRCGQHSGRSWAGKLSVVHSVLENCARFAQRNRNASDYCGKTFVGIAARTGIGTGNLRRFGKNVTRSVTFDSGQEMKTLLAIRYSLFANLGRSSND